MEFCLVMEVRKHSPEIAGKKRKDSVWGAGLPSLSLSPEPPPAQCIYHSLLLQLKHGYFSRWQVEITTRHKKYERNRSLIFWDVKPRHNSAFFSISSFECKTGANVPAGNRTVQQRDLCWGKEAELHYEVTRGFREWETWFLCSPVLPVFRHYPWHMPFNLSVPQLLHLESEEH